MNRIINPGGESDGEPGGKGSDHGQRTVYRIIAAVPSSAVSRGKTQTRSEGKSLRIGGGELPAVCEFTQFRGRAEKGPAGVGNPETGCRQAFSSGESDPVSEFSPEIS